MSFPSPCLSSRTGQSGRGGPLVPARVLPLRLLSGARRRSHHNTAPPILRRRRPPRAQLEKPPALVLLPPSCCSRPHVVEQQRSFRRNPGETDRFNSRRSKSLAACPTPARGGRLQDCRRTNRSHFPADAACLANHVLRRLHLCMEHTTGTHCTHQNDLSFPVKREPGRPHMEKPRGDGAGEHPLAGRETIQTNATQQRPLRPGPNSCRSFRRSGPPPATGALCPRPGPLKAG